MIDKDLNFTDHVDHALGKAKGTFGKISYLLKGRKGLPLKEAIEMYKALIRPHMEYGVAAWASMKESDAKRLEVMQSKSLRQLIGAKAHSSTDAIEVIVNVPPFRLRSWDLCMREFIRIQAKEDSHHLKSMMNNSMEKGRQLSPCAILKQQSREWSSMTDDLILWPDVTSPHNRIIGAANIEEFQLFEPGTMGNSNSRSRTQRLHGKATVETFLQSHKGRSVVVFKMVQ